MNTGGSSRVEFEAKLILNVTRPKPQRQDGPTGGTGLNMNYSIIFREISFYSETSILLQIIQIIHMTKRIKPESDQ